MATEQEQAECQPVNYRDHLEIEPGRRSGKPCIIGTRMTVYDVLGYLAAGMTHEELLDDFPYLTETHIRACLAFAADIGNKVEVIYTLPRTGEP